MNSKISIFNQYIMKIKLYISKSTKQRREPPMETTLVADWVFSHLKYRRPIYRVKGEGTRVDIPIRTLGTLKPPVERQGYLPWCLIQDPKREDEYRK